MLASKADQTILIFQDFYIFYW